MNILLADATKVTSNLLKVTGDRILRVDTASVARHARVSQLLAAREVWHIMKKTMTISSKTDKKLDS